MDLSRARRIPSPPLLFPRPQSHPERKTIESLTFNYNEIKWGHLLNTRVEAKNLRQRDIFSILLLNPVRKPHQFYWGWWKYLQKEEHQVFIPASCRQGGRGQSSVLSNGVYFYSNGADHD